MANPVRIRNNAYQNGEVASHFLISLSTHYVSLKCPSPNYIRSFDISGVDADKIKAKYVDGVLRLTLPKLEQRLPEGRRLEIE